MNRKNNPYPPCLLRKSQKVSRSVIAKGSTKQSNELQIFALLAMTQPRYNISNTPTGEVRKSKRIE
jgi:hypothetical protein